MSSHLIRKIKYVIAFILGGIYASGWWGVFVVDSKHAIFALPFVIVFFGTIASVILIFATLGHHWNDEDGHN